MNLYDQERIQEIRQNKLIEQNGKCAACGKLFMFGDKIELAHILAQKQFLIKKYGADVIHHQLNLKATHTGKCNSDVQMNSNKTSLVRAHVSAIRKEIEEEAIQEVMDRR